MVTVITPFQHNLTPLVEFLNDNKPLKELPHGLCILKSSAQIFQVRRLQSMLTKENGLLVLIFSIIVHICYFIVDH